MSGIVWEGVWGCLEDLPELPQRATFKNHRFLRGFPTPQRPPPLSGPLEAILVFNLSIFALQLDGFILGGFGAVWAPSEAVWSRLEAVWGSLGPSGPVWGCLEPSGSRLVLSGAV